MSNLCDTSITINAGKECINKFMRFFNRNKDEHERVWYGRFVAQEFGILSDKNLYEFIRAKQIDCRSDLMLSSVDKESVNLFADDAWRPHLRYIVKFLDRLNLPYELTFSAVEPGCELFVTNDPQLIGERVYSDEDIEEELLYIEDVESDVFKENFDRMRNFFWEKANPEEF